MAKNTNFVEIDGRIVEIEDMDLYNRVGSLAAYNAALGNTVEPSVWGKLFAWNQARAQARAEAHANNLVENSRVEYSPPALETTPRKEEKPYDMEDSWDDCRDVDGTPILGWWQ